jgi:hypothetical protein
MSATAAVKNCLNINQASQRHQGIQHRRSIAFGTNNIGQKRPKCVGQNHDFVIVVGILLFVQSVLFSSWVKIKNKWFGVKLDVILGRFFRQKEFG